MNEAPTPPDDPLDHPQGDGQELFCDRFMAEYTDFPTWDGFKRRLAATPREERDRFVAEHSVFDSWRAMEDAALGQLVFRRLDLE